MAHVQEPYSGLWKPDSVTTNKVDSQKMFITNIDQEEANYLSLLKRVAQSVASITALRAVNTTDQNIYANGIVIMVSGNALLYWLDRTSSESDNGTTIIAPTTGDGRWKLAGIPINHASSADTYGKGTADLFGHVKLSDSQTGSNGATSGVGASELAVKTAVTNAGTNLTNHVNARGTASVFSHIKLSDAIDGTNRAANSVGASEYALGYLSKVVFDGLNALTWAEINSIAASGKAANYFKVGDKKNVTLLNGEVITLEIADFAHDNTNSAGTTKAPISFIVKNCLQFTGTRYMNSTATNVGSWNSSYMRATVMAEVLAQLPSDLKSVIKTVYKKTTSGNQSTSIQTTSDQLWLPSCIEVSTVTSGAGYVDEGTQYPLFTDNNSRIKLYNGSANHWWLRSPHTGGAAIFCYVGTDGGRNGGTANDTYGVVFGLCV